MVNGAFRGTSARDRILPAAALLTFALLVMTSAGCIDDGGGGGGKKGGGGEDARPMYALNLTYLDDTETSPGVWDVLISGTGDVIEPDDDIVAIGSGGPYALAAARALMQTSEDMPARDIVEHALTIAADICVYTNNNLTILEL